jgi:hypothetical protein
VSEIDWASLQKEADDVLLPDGEYPMIVVDANAVESSNGKPMIKLVLAATEGPKKDRKVWTQLVLSAENPIAIKMWFTQLAAFGLGADFFATKPTMDQLATELKNRGVLAKIGRREWQGADRNQVEAYKTYTPSGPIPPGMKLGAPTMGGPSAPGTVATAGPMVSTNGPTVGPSPVVGPGPTAAPTAGPTPPSAPPKDPF